MTKQVAISQIAGSIMRDSCVTGHQRHSEILIADMSDDSKREACRQHVIESLRQPGDPDPEPPRCHCGKPAVFEVNRKSGMTFVCAEYAPRGVGSITMKIA